MGTALSQRGDPSNRRFPDFQSACARGKGVEGAVSCIALWHVLDTPSLQGDICSILWEMDTRGGPQVVEGCIVSFLGAVSVHKLMSWPLSMLWVRDGRYCISADHCIHSVGVSGE